ncbi:hypothetical protein M569_13420 [Genlisea aurea]|uniref:DUF7851 domain-containing protein n=1 Tax=Genlisea aurea TaxID=192259 RepID=S8DNX0_9LAMI|nr:hypothetical protein M569_13420 [Genlisea aurea]
MAEGITHKKQKKLNHLSDANFAFRPSALVKGLRFGGQFIVRSFTVRRALLPELLRLLSLPTAKSRFASTAAFIPTNFTILAHKAWQTLTLGLGTNKSKVTVFVFESEAMKAAVERIWPAEIALGDVNKKLIRNLNGSEMARFKFRKGCITFYIYAVRRIGNSGFNSAKDLKTILQSVTEINDFIDHTAMLAMPKQKSVSYAPPLAVAV